MVFTFCDKMRAFGTITHVHTRKKEGYKVQRDMINRLTSPPEL